MIERVSAIDVIRNAHPLHGGSQAQTMRCSDGYDYVVKFQNNPQGKEPYSTMLLARFSHDIWDCL